MKQIMIYSLISMVVVSLLVACGLTASYREVKISSGSKKRTEVKLEIKEEKEEKI